MGFSHKIKRKYVSLHSNERSTNNLQNKILSNIVSNSCCAPQIIGIYQLNDGTNASILNPRFHLLTKSKHFLISKNFKSMNYLNELQFSPPNDRVVNNNYHHRLHEQMNEIRFSSNLNAKTATVVPKFILSRRHLCAINMTIGS